MEILADARPQKGQDLEGCIFNVSFQFSRDRSLCIGFRYVGGNPDNSRNYRFDHANLWMGGIEEHENLPKKEAQAILRRHHLTLREMSSYLE